MSDRFLKPIVFAFILLCVSPVTGATLLDDLRDQLSAANNASDSIITLYNIYDCSTHSQQGDVLKELYATAKKAGDVRAMSDALKMAANYYTANDSMQNVLMRLAQTLPDGDDKRSTILFMKVRATSKLARSLSETEREVKLRSYLSQYAASSSMDIYQRIEYLFYLCAYIRAATEGELLTKYFLELQDLIDQLPARELPLKSLFYTQAAVSYLANDMYEQSVEANKTLLDIIAELERQYELSGRIYKNYNRSAYICYRRLLSCYEYLTEEEVEDYYSRLIDLLDSDASLRHDFEQRQRAKIYYFMAKKRYDEAIPVIKEQLNDLTNTRAEQQFLVDALIKASRATGNKSDEIHALQLSNDMMKQRINARAAETYKEMQIVYEVNDLKQENSELMLANQQILSAKRKRQMTYAAVGLVVLVVLLVIVYVLYRRSRILTDNLSASNDMIISERDALQSAQKELIDARDKAKTADRIKTDFVNNMSHQIRTPLAAIVEYSNLIADCAEDDKREYVRRFADIIALNTDLMLTLANDVLDLPSLESAKLSVSIRNASVQQICKTVIDTIVGHIAPGVKLIYTKADAIDFKIHTDPRRVEQVLLNILLNAAKFTNAGTITLDYELNADGTRLTFVVTDTGIGIPKGKEEIIFSRFEKLNSEAQGNGLGLYIGRLLAELLKGELLLDKEYRNGARFMFTIPTNC